MRLSLGDHKSSIRLLALLAASIFVGEALIMLVIEDVAVGGPFALAVVDAAILTVILFPVLYALVFKRLVRQNEALSVAERELKSGQMKLEQRIDERTRELADANRNLRKSLENLNLRQREMVVLGEMGQALQACGNLDSLYEVAARHLQRLLPQQAGALYLVRSSGNVLERTLEWGGSTGLAERFAPEDCWALCHGSPQHFGQCDSAMSCQHADKVVFADGLCMPITAHGETLGTLCLQMPDRKTEPLTSDRHLAPAPSQFYTTVAETLGLAIANMKLRETLSHQALIDPLTGLFNRRYFKDSLERELERSTATGASVSVALLDIDNFKNFNDRFGHDGGDTLLSVLGGFLRERKRDADIVARYGGEEFAIVLPETDATAAADRMDVLRQEIAALTVEHDGAPIGRITVSVGIAAFPESVADCDTLMRAADQALYGSKQNGRNRVSLAETKDVSAGKTGGDGAGPTPTTADDCMAAQEVRSASDLDGLIAAARRLVDAGRDPEEPAAADRARG